MQVEDSRTPGLFVERLARRLTCVDASATRFDEISPLWQKIKSLAILKGLFSYNVAISRTYFDNYFLLLAKLSFV